MLHGKFDDGDVPPTMCLCDVPSTSNPVFVDSVFWKWIQNCRARDQSECVKMHEIFQNPEIATGKSTRMKKKNAGQEHCI